MPNALYHFIFFATQAPCFIRMFAISAAVAMSSICSAAYSGEVFAWRCAMTQQSVTQKE